MLLLGLLFVVVTSSGCWEQVSAEWFPQMKWQPAVQAFERNDFQDRVVLFSPPEGTVPVGWGDVADPASLSIAEQEAILNPVVSTLASLKNGEMLFQRNWFGQWSDRGAEWPDSGRAADRSRCRLQPRARPHRWAYLHHHLHRPRPDAKLQTHSAGGSLGHRQLHT
jgi:hypothetical protein